MTECNKKFVKIGNSVPKFAIKNKLTRNDGPWQQHFHKKILFFYLVIYYLFIYFSVDPEVYVPREDDTRYNEVDFDSEDTKYNKDYDAQLRDEVAVESVVIIVLVSLLVTLLFFGKWLYFIFEKS